MLERFTEILQKTHEKELHPFLKSLSADDKKKLVPGIKKLSAEYLKYREHKDKSGHLSYQQMASEKQQNILLVASFVCFNRSDFEKVQYPGWIMQKELLRPLLDWYCPAWFNDFVNSLAEKGRFFYTVNYNWITELEERGIIKPSKRLIVNFLPQVIFEANGRTHQYKPENVLRHPATLERHIWYLFEEESSIYHSDRWLNFGTDISKDHIGWAVLLKHYSSEGKIERKRLLREALLASNRNFNKLFSGWSIDLFGALAPSDTELLQLQKELFSVLYSPHTKPVNMVLQYCKKLVDHTDFDIQGFLDTAPVLFAAGAKNVTITTLALLEKIGKRHVVFQLPVCKAVLQVFIVNDEDLQLRAAKLLMLFSGSVNNQFITDIQPYFSSILSSPKKVLEKFYTEDEPINKDDFSAENLSDDSGLKEELPLIPAVESMDDFLFLASQAFDNNESWHIDILPAALVQWQHELTGENVAKLEPALQRALNITTQRLSSRQGQLDSMLAIFFIDVCIFFIRKFPDDTKRLQTLFSKFDGKEEGVAKRWLDIEENKLYLLGWNMHYDIAPFIIHRQLLVTAIVKVWIGHNLPLLSTPTHSPSWIVPEVLVQRIAVYQNAAQEPANSDWQMAVSRCRLVNTAPAIKLAKELLVGEYLNMALFLLGEHEQPHGPFINTSVWMCCSLALGNKKTYPEFKDFAYYKRPFDCYIANYPWQARGSILEVRVDKCLPKNSSKIVENLSYFSEGSREETSLIYDVLNVSSHWCSNANDIRRILLLTPNNPDYLLADILRQSLVYPQFWESNDRQVVEMCMQTMHEIWQDFGEMAYLFLASCMLCADKTVAGVAGETWIKAVSENRIDSTRLGKTLGIEERKEFAPLKRFADIASQQFFRISAKHNKELQHLIEHMLVELPDEPVKNLKKLLELYSELVETNKMSASNDLLNEKLDAWKGNSVLQKQIKNIKNKFLFE